MGKIKVGDIVHDKDTKGIFKITAIYGERCSIKVVKSYYYQDDASKDVVGNKVNEGDFFTNEKLEPFYIPLKSILKKL